MSKNTAQQGPERLTLDHTDTRDKTIIEWSPRHPVYEFRVREVLVFTNGRWEIPTVFTSKATVAI